MWFGSSKEQILSYGAYEFEEMRNHYPRWNRSSSEHQCATPGAAAAAVRLVLLPATMLLLLLGSDFPLLTCGMHSDIDGSSSSRLDDELAQGHSYTTDGEEVILRWRVDAATETVDIALELELDSAAGGWVAFGLGEPGSASMPGARDPVSRQISLSPPLVFGLIRFPFTCGLFSQVGVFSPSKRPNELRNI